MAKKSPLFIMSFINHEKLIVQFNTNPVTPSTNHVSYMQDLGILLKSIFINSYSTYIISLEKLNDLNRKR